MQRLVRLNTGCDKVRYEIVLYDDDEGDIVVINPDDILVGYDATLGKIIVLRAKRSRN